MEEQPTEFATRVLLGGECALPPRTIYSSRSKCICNRQLRCFPELHARICFIKQNGLLQDDPPEEGYASVVELLYRRRLKDCCALTVLGDPDGIEERVSAKTTVQRLENPNPSGNCLGSYLPTLRRLLPDVLTRAVLNVNGFHTMQWHAVQWTLRKLITEEFQVLYDLEGLNIGGKTYKAIEAIVAPKYYGDVTTMPSGTTAVLIHGEVEVRLHPGVEGPPISSRVPTDLVPLMAVPCVDTMNGSFRLEGTAYEMIWQHAARPYLPIVSVTPLLPPGHSKAPKKASRKSSCVMVFGETAPSFVPRLELLGRLKQGADLEIRVRVPMQPRPVRLREDLRSRGLGILGPVQKPDDQWMRSVPIVCFWQWLSKETTYPEVMQRVLGAAQGYASAAAIEHLVKASLQASCSPFDTARFHGDLRPESYCLALGPGSLMEDVQLCLADMTARLILATHGILQPDELEASKSLAGLGTGYWRLVRERIQAALDAAVVSWIKSPTEKGEEGSAAASADPPPRVLQVQPSFDSYHSLWIEPSEDGEEAFEYMIEEAATLQLQILTGEGPAPHQLPSWLPRTKPLTPPMVMYIKNSGAICPNCSTGESCNHVTAFHMTFEAQAKRRLDAAPTSAADLARALACHMARSPRIFKDLAARLRGLVECHWEDQLRGLRREYSFGERANPKLFDTYKLLIAKGQSKTSGYELNEASSMRDNIFLQGEGRRGFLLTGVCIMEPLPPELLTRLHAILVTKLAVLAAPRQSEPSIRIRFMGRVLRVVEGSLPATLQLIDSLRAIIRAEAVASKDARFHFAVVDLQQMHNRQKEIVVSCNGGEVVVPLQARRFSAGEIDVMAAPDSHRGSWPDIWREELEQLTKQDPAASYSPSLPALLAAGVLLYVLPNRYLTLLSPEHYAQRAEIGKGLDAMTLGKLGPETSFHARSVEAEDLARGGAGDPSRHYSFAKGEADSASPPLIDGPGYFAHSSNGVDLGANLHNMVTPTPGQRFTAVSIPTAIVGTVQGDEDSMPLVFSGGVFDHETSMTVKQTIVRRNLKEDKGVMSLAACATKFYAQLQRRQPSLPSIRPTAFTDALNATGLPSPGAFVPAGCCMYLNLGSDGNDIKGAVASEDAWILSIEDKTALREPRTIILSCTMDVLNAGQKGIRFDQKMVVGWLRGHLGAVKAFFNCGSLYSRTSMQCIYKGLLTRYLAALGMTLFADVHRFDYRGEANAGKRKLCASAQSCFGTNLSLSELIIERSKAKVGVLCRRPLVHGESGTVYDGAVVLPQAMHISKHKAKRRVGSQKLVLPGQAPRLSGIDPIYCTVVAARQSEPVDEGQAVMMCPECGIVWGFCTHDCDLVEVNLRSSVGMALHHAVRLNVVAQVRLHHDDTLVSRRPLVNLLQRPQAPLEPTPAPVLWRNYHRVIARRLSDNFFAIGPGPTAYALCHAILQICGHPRSISTASIPAALSGDTSEGYCLEITPAALEWAVSELRRDCEELRSSLNAISPASLEEGETAIMNRDGSLSWYVPNNRRAAASLMVYGGAALPLLRAYLLEVAPELQRRVTHQVPGSDLETKDLKSFCCRFQYINLAECLATLPLTLASDSDGEMLVNLKLNTGRGDIDALDFKCPSGESLFGCSYFLGGNPWFRKWLLDGSPFPAMLTFKFRLIRAAGSHRKTMWHELRQSSPSDEVGDLVAGGPPALVDISARWESRIFPSINFEEPQEVQAALTALLPDIRAACPQGVADEAVALRSAGKTEAEQLKALAKGIRRDCDLCGKRRGCGDCRLALTMHDIEDQPIFLERIRTATVESREPLGRRLVDRDIVSAEMLKTSSTPRSHRLQPNSTVWVFNCSTNEHLKDEPLPMWPPQENEETAQAFRYLLGTIHPPLERSQAALKVLQEGANHVLKVLAEVTSSMNHSYCSD